MTKYEILKKHETLLKHYNLSKCLGNGWGSQLQEIQSVIGGNLNCGACIGEMLNTAWNVLQLLEKEMAKESTQIINGDSKEESQPVKKRGNPNFGKK